MSLLVRSWLFDQRLELAPTIFQHWLKRLVEILKNHVSSREIFSKPCRNPLQTPITRKKILKLKISFPTWCMIFTGHGVTSPSNSLNYASRTAFKRGCSKINKRGPKGSIKVLTTPLQTPTSNRRYKCSRLLDWLDISRKTLSAPFDIKAARRVQFQKGWCNHSLTMAYQLHRLQPKFIHPIN